MSVPKGPGLLEGEGEEEESYGTADSMDPELYRATTEGDILEFIIAMERDHVDSGANRPHSSPASCVQLGPQKNTVLHLAVSFRHHEIVKLLCKDLPFLVAEKNAKGDTALHIAARGGDSLLVGLLISCEFRGSALAEKNEEGNTALHEALVHRHEAVAWMLIHKNRNLSYSVNKEGKSVLYLGAEAGYVTLVKLLMENPVGNCFASGRLKSKSPVHAAILGRNIDVLKTLWDKDQSSYQIRCDDEGRNALHLATSTGYIEGVSFLLNKYPISAYQMDKYGFFPIHVASSKGHVDIIEEMLRQCPDTRELLTSKGHNILHVAGKSGKAKAVAYMLKMPELEDLINERDKDGNTPLHIATTYGHPSVVSTLMWDDRVKPHLQNNSRLTALDIAEEHMETMASFRKRFTWMALRVTGAPRAPESNAARRKFARVQKHPRPENYSSKVNVVLLVATFVATVTFTAGFTLPGGYNNSNPDQGIATMLAKVKFQEFIICDILAMYTSIIVVVSLIWAQLGDLGSMHLTLKLAVPLLGISLILMSIAFMAGVYVVVSKLNWLANLVFFMGSNFVTMVALFFPLCFLGSCNFQFSRRVSKGPLLLILYAFRSYTDHEDAEEWVDVATDTFCISTQPCGQL